jgi:NADP-dependent alcohol dehydrogenase
MENFEFYNPVKILFGKGQIEKLKTLISSDKNILIIYGQGSIFKNGVYIDVVKALNGFRFMEFGGIEPNPTHETSMEAVKIIKENKIDFILAVGGGSVIDATKYIAAATYFNNNGPWEILSKGAVIEKALPFGTILTLPATGSEMNANSVISKKSTQEKLAFSSLKVMPQFSILDPTTAASLPKNQVANGWIIINNWTNFDKRFQNRFCHSIL